MSVSRYRVSGNFDGAREATVEIDRKSLLVTVRPLRRRIAFGPLPLATLAEMHVWRCVKAEVAAAKAAKKRRAG